MKKCQYIRTSIKQGLGISASSESCIDKRFTGSGLHHLKDLVKHDRYMSGRSANDIFVNTVTRQWSRPPFGVQAASGNYRAGTPHRCNFLSGFIAVGLKASRFPQLEKMSSADKRNTVLNAGLLSNCIV